MLRVLEEVWEKTGTMLDFDDSPEDLADEERGLAPYRGALPPIGPDDRNSYVLNLIYADRPDGSPGGPPPRSESSD
jgi:hypothetical protein